MDITEVCFNGLQVLFYKKSQGSGANNEIKHNKQLAQELHRPIIKIK